MTESRKTSSFITWYPSCRRSDGIAAALGAPSHLVHVLDFKTPWQAPLRYVAQSVRTLQLLWREQPEFVIVAAPPVFAPLVCWLFTAARGRTLVVDAHTGVFDDPRWRWAQPFHRWLARRTITIVTSSDLAETVRAWGGRPVVLGTVPVSFPDAAEAELDGLHVVGVTTFSDDEPIEDMIEAARQLPDMTLHLTGRPRPQHASLLDNAPSNVRPTGWISDVEYHALLRRADIAMCLTTRDMTMQRGGYEAMALGTPLITSDWDLLRRTFSLGTFHVDNSAADIAAAVRSIAGDCERYRTEMLELRELRSADFQRSIDALHQALSEN